MGDDTSSRRRIQSVYGRWELDTMAHGLRIMYRHDGTRYEFHHNEECQMFFAAGESSRYNENSIPISILDACTMERITYRIIDPYRFPLREIMYTFVEQVGARIEQLEFRYRGILIPLDATPRSLGMDNNQRPEEENVITVTVVTSLHDRRRELLTRLNRMGKVCIGTAPYQGTVFNADILPRILDFVDLETLVATVQVCRHWFHVSQRFSVLLQLQDGDLDTWQEHQQYPVLLHDGCRHSFNLALCEKNENINKWSTANLQKEMTNNHGFGFCKAAGCKIAKTVWMESISRALDSKWQTLHSNKTDFMRQMQQEYQQLLNEEDGRAISEQGLQRQEELQEFPPPGKAGDGFIAEARDWRYKNCAVELYRRYFSPDMYYIFPLIVNQQSAVGLDFRDAHTSLIFRGSSSSSETDEMVERGEFVTRRGPTRVTRRDWEWEIQSGVGPEGLPSPLGSVSWRIHDAAKVAAQGMGRIEEGNHDNDGMTEQYSSSLCGWRPQIVLEVLFIAVWESDRGGEYGSHLVEALQLEAIRHAKANGCQSALLYVEIGFEQPKAKLFWGHNNGFARVVRRQEGQTQTVVEKEVEEVRTSMSPPRRRRRIAPQGEDSQSRVIELENWELGFINRRCLRFKDTVQYAKKVLV